VVVIQHKGAKKGPQLETDSLPSLFSCPRDDENELLAILILISNHPTRPQTAPLPGAPFLVQRSPGESKKAVENTRPRRRGFCSLPLFSSLVVVVFGA